MGLDGVMKVRLTRPVIAQVTAAACAVGLDASAWVRVRIMEALAQVDHNRATSGPQAGHNRATTGPQAASLLDLSDLRSSDLGSDPVPASALTPGISASSKPSEIGSESDAGAREAASVPAKTTRAPSAGVQALLACERVSGGRVVLDDPSTWAESWGPGKAGRGAFAVLAKRMTEWPTEKHWGDLGRYLRDIARPGTLGLRTLLTHPRLVRWMADARDWCAQLDAIPGAEGNPLWRVDALRKALDDARSTVVVAPAAVEDVEPGVLRELVTRDAPRTPSEAEDARTRYNRAARDWATLAEWIAAGHLHWLNGSITPRLLAHKAGEWMGAAGAWAAKGRVALRTPNAPPQREWDFPDEVAAYRALRK